MPIDKNFYDEKAIKSYKERLAFALVKDGLSADAIAENAIYKQYLMNFAEQNVLQTQTKDKILGFTYAMAVMDLDVYGNEQNEYRSFPIINKFKGHNLIESIYFRKDGTDGIATSIIPMIVPTIYQ